MKQSVGLGIVLKMSTKKTAFPWYFFYKVARLHAMLFFASLFVIVLVYRNSLKQGLILQVVDQVKEELETTQLSLKVYEQSWIDWCRGIRHTEHTRYTIISSAGHIQCDTKPKTDNGTLLDKPEIVEAAEKGFAYKVRKSAQFGSDAIFVVLRVGNPEYTYFVRKTVPLTSFSDKLNFVDGTIFSVILPLAIFFYFLFLWAFARISQPLRVILSKVSQIQTDLPHDQKLRLFYKKDEWAQITAALSEADHQLKTQLQIIKTENDKISTLLEAITDEIIAIDSSSTVLFYNSRFSKTFLQDRERLQDKGKLWCFIDLEEINNGFTEVLKTKNSLKLRQIPIKVSDRVKYYNVTFSPLKSDSGAIAVFHDVTETKLTEQMRVDFVANVSHEIRTPLTSIKGFSQILKSQKHQIPEHLHEFLEKILQNTERMISLFNDLLNLSVIESKNNIRFENIDLSEVVEHITENMQTIYQNKKIVVEKDFSHFEMLADPKLFEQVLTNLMDNAIKYSGETPTIKIEAQKKQESVKITVTDHGQGISPEHLERIFERFYRIDHARDRESGGTGLGLSIVKHIINKHGGKIWAESAPEIGTRFIIELPHQKMYSNSTP